MSDCVNLKEPKSFWDEYVSLWNDPGLTWDDPGWIWDKTKRNWDDEGEIWDDENVISNYDFKEIIIQDRQTHRTKSGKLFNYGFNSILRLEITQRYTEQNTAAFINDTTFANSCFLYEGRTLYHINPQDPFSQYESPSYQTKQRGVIILESI